MIFLSINLKRESRTSDPLIPSLTLFHWDTMLQENEYQHLVFYSFIKQLQIF